MRIVYRDGWEETFILSTRIIYAANTAPAMALVMSPSGGIVAWRMASTIREVYAL